MQTQTADHLMREADALLERAENETNRSSTAMVTHSICHAARQAIHHYLSSYLMTKGEAIEDNETLAVLVEKCTTFEPRFEKLELIILENCLKVINDDGTIYCLSAGQVISCLEVAKETQSLVYKVI